MRDYGTGVKKRQPTGTGRGIYETLRHWRTIPHTTVMTTMVRLAEKGLLRIVDKAGLANCYAPAENRDEFIRNAVGRVLDIFISDFPQEANQFLEDHAAGKAKK